MEPTEFTTISSEQLDFFDPLKVSLGSYEGPLEVLLQLIRQQKMDIQSISLSSICQIYLEFLDNIKELDLDVAAEFIAIAATLILIKSRTLLPNSAENNEDETLPDPETELKLKLIEYQKYKEISNFLNERDQLCREFFARPFVAEREESPPTFTFEDLSIYGLLNAYQKVITRHYEKRPHLVREDEFPIEYKIMELMEKFQTNELCSFLELISQKSNKIEIIVTFMAILELGKMNLLKLSQIEAFGNIYCHPFPSIGEHITNYREIINRLK